MKDSAKPGNIATKLGHKQPRNCMKRLKKVSIKCQISLQKIVKTCLKRYSLFQ